MAIAKLENLQKIDNRLHAPVQKLITQFNQIMNAEGPTFNKKNTSGVAYQNKIGFFEQIEDKICKITMDAYNGVLNKESIKKKVNDLEDFIEKNSFSTDSGFMMAIKKAIAHLFLLLGWLSTDLQEKGKKMLAETQTKALSEGHVNSTKAAVKTFFDSGAFSSDNPTVSIFKSSK